MASDTAFLIPEPSGAEGAHFAVLGQRQQRVIEPFAQGAAGCYSHAKGL